jgi:hypothetical protein
MKRIIQVAPAIAWQKGREKTWVRDIAKNNHWKHF